MRSVQVLGSADTSFWKWIEEVASFAIIENHLLEWIWYGSATRAVLLMDDTNEFRAAFKPIDSISPSFWKYCMTSSLGPYLCAGHSGELATPGVTGQLLNLLAGALFARTAVRKYDRWGGLNNRNLLSHKPRPRVCILLRTTRQKLFYTSKSLLVFASNLWGSLAYRNITMISAFLITWSSPCYVQISPYDKDTSHTVLGMYPSPIWSQLIISVEPYFPMRSHFEVLGVKTSIHELWCGQCDSTHNNREGIDRVHRLLHGMTIIHQKHDWTSTDKPHKIFRPNSDVYVIQNELLAPFHLVNSLLWPLYPSWEICLLRFTCRSTLLNRSLRWNNLL